MQTLRDVTNFVGEQALTDVEYWAENTGSEPTVLISADLAKEYGRQWANRLGQHLGLVCCEAQPTSHHCRLLGEGKESTNTRVRVMGYYPGAGWLRVARTDESDSSSPGASE